MVTISSMTQPPTTVTATASNLPLVAKYNKAHKNEIGLGVGFGLLLLIILIGGVLGALYIRRLRSRLRNVPVVEPAPTEPTSGLIHGGWDRDSEADNSLRSPYMRETISTR